MSMGVKCLLEASLSIGTVIINPSTDRYSLTKTGWFLINDSHLGLGHSIIVVKNK